VDEVYIFARESQVRERQKARTAMFAAMSQGRAVGVDEMARARGLVIRERENSIFSDAWLPLALIFIITGLLANRNGALLALGIGLFIIVGFSKWWMRLALAGVTYERSFDRSHVFPGELLNMTLTINNRKLLPLTWLYFRDSLPVAPENEGQLTVLASEITGTYLLQNTLSMNGYERIQRSVELRFPRRGYYDIGPVQYQSGDIFTLFTIDRQHRYLDRIIVYPQVYPLEVLELPAKEMFGEIKVRRSLFTDPIKTQGIRDYQPQDRFRDVHWKATARRGDLQTKVYEPTSGMTVVVFLNVATFARHWMGFEPAQLERAISVAGSIASYAAEHKWGVGLVANGSVPGSDQPIRVAPGRSPEQLIRILEALAAVTEFATGSIELLMHAESRRLPWASTLVLVSAVVTEEILVSLVRLQEAGRRVVLISLADELPPARTRDILIYHVPPDAAAFAGRAAGPSLTEAALGTVPVPNGVRPPQTPEVSYEPGPGR
jgi:uncharacterized protein (DUF58 family)